MDLVTEMNLHVQLGDEVPLQGLRSQVSLEHVGHFGYPMGASNSKVCEGITTKWTLTS